LDKICKGNRKAGDEYWELRLGFFVECTGAERDGRRRRAKRDEAEREREKW
jgi:hypothetical protein